MLFKSKTVVAHNGEFHADDVFAVACLSLFLGRIKIVRTRDEKIISTAHYVVDVGGTFEPAKNRFDHHQTGGAGKRPNGIPYASFGLVWKTYGEKIAGSKEAADLIDQKLVSPVDGLDNGVAISEELFEDIRNYGISSLVASMNPTWLEDKSKTDALFKKAVQLAKSILQREIALAKASLEAEKRVLDVYNQTEDKRVLVLDQNYNWGRAVHKLPEPLFVISPRETEWRVGTVKKNFSSFENRKDLPSAWAGKMNGELAAVAGVPDALFCHNKLFLASARSKEGALKLAKIALEA